MSVTGQIMRNTRFIILIFSFTLLFGFYQFSRFMKTGGMKQVDFDSTVKIQNRIPARLDELWVDSAFFVTPAPSVVLVGILTIAAFVDLKNKKVRLRALIIPVLFGLLVMGEIYGKNAVHHPAPLFFMIKNPTTLFPKYYINEQYSYPSGHTARAVFLGLTSYSLFMIPFGLAQGGHDSVFKSKRRKLSVAAVIIGYICIVAVGRIYLGHHWLSDVIGGVLLGGGLGVLTLLLISPIITHTMSD
jgi:membrane-associated phospholipid phosphatase